jgi:hypothetical protein
LLFLQYSYELLSPLYLGSSWPWMPIVTVPYFLVKFSMTTSFISYVICSLVRPVTPSGL